MSRLIAVIIGLAICLPVWAQSERPVVRPNQDPGGSEPSSDDGQSKRREAARPQVRGAQPAGRVAERLKAALDLDADQQKKFDEIASRYREERDAEGDRAEQMRDIMRQMREARDADDQERVKQLEQQLTDLRQNGGAKMEKFLDEVEGILREDQIEKLASFREREMGRFREPGRRRGELDFDDLKAALKLDNKQTARFDELAAAAAPDAAGGPEAGTRELAEEMRRAVQEGDQVRIQELRDRLRERRDVGGRAAALDTFFAELEKILNDEQKKLLAEWREKNDRGGGRDRASDYRTLLRAARRVKLDDAQRQEIDEIEQQAAKASREVRRSDSAAQQELYNSIREQIVAALKPDQVKEFEAALVRLDRSGRGGRADDGERIPRPRRNPDQPIDPGPGGDTGETP